jgi:phenylalanine-4-hydroxylase
VNNVAPTPDWTVPQDWEHFTAVDHGVWDHLFDRQTRLLPGRVAPEFLDGLAARPDAAWRAGFCPVER